MKWLYGTLCALFVGLLFYFVPFYVRLDQDRCEFGTGSTTLYKSLSRRANAYMARHDKVQLRNRDDASKKAFARAFTQQFNEFIDPNWPFQVRLAAAHALVRQYGGDFDKLSWTKRSRVDAFRVPHISLHYFVHLPKLNWLCLSCYLRREGTINVFFGRNRAGIYNQVNADARWDANQSPLRSLRLWFDKRRNQVCPEFRGSTEGI